MYWKPLMYNSIRILPLILALSLTGCSVGPRYKRPDIALPQKFTAPSTENLQQTPVADAGDAEFWHGFQDAQLSALVEQALKANNDLQAAIAHYDSSNALLRAAKFDRYPTVTMNAQGGRQQIGDSQAYGYSPVSRFFNAGMNASWELDFWGRVRHNIEAQRELAAASASDLAALQVTIVGDVASVYIDLRGQQERLRIARENVDNERETVRLVEARLAAGRGTDFDVERARAQLESTTALIPALLTSIAVDEHRLAVLCGRTPDALIGELDSAKPLPVPPPSIDPGTPADLVRRRPDIAAAEQRLHAATEQIGIATADLFPRLSFAGMFGGYGSRSGTPFDSISPISLAALDIDWSFLDVGRVRARLDATRADSSAQLAQYQQTVLLALEDVENSLVGYAHAQERTTQLERATQDSRQATQLARARFTNGATGLLDLLDAQREQLQAEESLAESRSSSGIAAVSLYKALAGGWPQQLPSRAAVAKAQKH
ncbi:MAG TPA: efflux transporter outer membrane subunit [Alloacidobacterium sp.]|nr:efflux transporter outer membrane subunit [Alloacidobacterium sp.]